jgi:hypothetical protein
MYVGFQQMNQPKRSDRRFHYETMWEAHPDFANSLKESWARAGAANSVADLVVKLKEVSSHLSVWNRDT